MNAQLGLSPYRDNVIDLCDLIELLTNLFDDYRFNVAHTLYKDVHIWLIAFTMDLHCHGFNKWFHFHLVKHILHYHTILCDQFFLLLNHL